MTILELELGELKARVERLEMKVRRLVGEDPQAMPPVPCEPLDQERLITWLKSAGLVRDPTPEELRLAAQWDALSDEEKEAHIRFMRTLVLDPSLSEIIVENRR